MYHRTALSRKVLSGPMKFLKGKDFLLGKILDYGCGRGHDVNSLSSQGFIISGYDPNTEEFSIIPSEKFTTITCNFVLNVIPTESERKSVLDKIYGMLEDGGKAYISVRADKANLKGWTSTGTFQTFVNLDLPVLKKTSSFITYVYSKE